jgi:hypothetical protein
VTLNAVDVEHGYTFRLPPAAGALSRIALAAVALPGAIHQGNKITSWASIYPKTGPLMTSQSFSACKEG